MSKRAKKPKTTAQLEQEFRTSKKKGNRKIAIFSGIAGLVVIIAAFQVVAITGDNTLRDVLFVAGLLVAVVPPTLKQHQAAKRLANIDSNLPMFIQSLVGAVQSGSSLMHAVESAADRKMGALTPELKTLRANISWGVPLDEAFENFRKRVPTMLARRVSTLLEISINSGGNVVKSLEVILKHVTDTKSIETERKSALAPYVSVIYISFFVFLVISVLLVSSFFSQIAIVQEELAASTSGGTGGMFSALMGMEVEQIKSILFNMAIIEAVFGGLAAGKIGSGTFVAGIKHIVIMIVITVIAFLVL